MENQVARKNITNRPNQQAGVDILENIALCAGQPGRQGGIIIRIGCEKDAACRGVTGMNLTSRFNPGAIRESGIHQDDVRVESCDRPHRVGFGSCLADDGNALIVV
jgi:hypothetical protein